MYPYSKTNTMISTLDSNQHWKLLPKKNPTALHQHPPKVALSDWTCSLPIKLYSDVFTSCIYIYIDLNLSRIKLRGHLLHMPRRPPSAFIHLNGERSKRIRCILTAAGNVKGDKSTPGGPATIEPTSL